MNVVDLLAQRGKVATFAAACVLTACAAGCANTPTATSAHKSAALEPITVQLDATLQGFNLPLVVAQSDGYYKKFGLNVTLESGSSAANADQAVATGQTTFAMADAGATALAITKGEPLKVVASYIQETQGVVVTRSSEGITSLKDLVGKSVALSTGSSSTEMLLAALSLQHIAVSSVELDYVPYTSKVSEFLSGRVDAETGFIEDECVQAKTTLSVPVTCLKDSTYGVHTLGESIIVSNSTIKDDPGLIKSFLAATDEGWIQAERNPQAAAEAGAAMFPGSSVSELKQVLIASIPLLHTSATHGQPLGYMAKSQWLGTLSYLHEAFQVPTQSVRNFYTNAYIVK